MYSNIGLSFCETVPLNGHFIHWMLGLVMQPQPLKQESSKITDQRCTLLSNNMRYMILKITWLTFFYIIDSAVYGYITLLGLSDIWYTAKLQLRCVWYTTKLQLRCVWYTAMLQLCCVWYTADFTFLQITLWKYDIKLNHPVMRPLISCLMKKPEAKHLMTLSL